MDASKLSSKLLEFEASANALASAFRQLRKQLDAPKKQRSGGLTPEERQRARTRHEATKIRRAAKIKSNT